MAIDVTAIHHSFALVVLVESPTQEDVETAAELGLKALPADSGRLLVDGLAESEVAHVREAFGDARTSAYWAIAIDTKEPSVAEIRGTLRREADEWEEVPSSRGERLAFALFRTRPASDVR